ncbi:hypothetical protein [Hoeflea sp. TYP-13]|uniref:hypothetical protein n=1 Tax=Hoeflea sp. TYP-13 TaxID=3230023 RepID=UPI0034C6CF13
MSGRNCPQALAGYSAADQRIMLEFSGAPDLSFFLLVEGAGAKFEGYTYPAEEEGGIAGVVLDECPDGDATGEEMAACTVWQGLVRTVTADGKIGDLSAANEPAAGHLRLDGLAAALGERMPDLVAGLAQNEIEILTLSACQE